jgi:NADH-quinone oxidoreductase subunit E
LTDPSLYDGSVVGAWKKRFAEEEAKARELAAAQSSEKAAAEKPAGTSAEAPKAAGATAEAAKAVGTAEPAKPAPTQPALLPVSDEHKPVLLTSPEGGKADDLELIWGVGPKLAQMLHKMGVFHFAQIAAWNEMNLRWVDQNLGAFKGRAVRDKWIEQSARLATGWRPEKSIGDKPQG